VGSLDSTLVEFFTGFTRQFVLVDWFVVVFSEYVPFLLAALFVLLVFRQPSWILRIRKLVEVGLVLAFAEGISAGIIRFMWPRERPFVALGLEPLFQEYGFSFPSRHAIWLAALACVVWSFNRKWGIRFWLVTVLIGLARVASGVHYVSDVFVGFLIPIIFFWLIDRFLPPLAQPAPVEVLEEEKKEEEKREEEKF
jgi:undecaprenyl-diphosphatase